jgi:hypothetical protein
VIGTVVSLLAARLAAGVLLVTALLAVPNRLPSSFLRFCLAVSALSAALAGMLGRDVAALAYGAVAAGALLGYWRLQKSPHPGFATIAPAILSLLALVLVCRGAESGGWAICVFGSLGSALLLGSVLVSMVLGHWYLVDTSLSIAPLKQGALWLIAAVLVRWLNVVTVMAREGWGIIQVSRAADLIYSTLGLFFLFRVLTGLVGLSLLAGPIWQTARMRSTQSATGLLYVALVLVLFGELMAQFLTSATGFPL